MLLGLDISTTCTGYTVLNDEGELVDIGHIDMSKLDRDVWIKAEVAKKHLVAICQKYKPTHIFIEDVIAKVSSGKSNIHTIALLIRFNILCSYFVMETSGVMPQYITASHARKLCGLKIQRGIKEKAKEQVFEQLRDSGPFKGKEWPLKRTGRVQDPYYDEVDSYVVARAGYYYLEP